MILFKIILRAYMKELLEALQNGNVDYVKTKLQEGLDPNIYLHTEDPEEGKTELPLLFALIANESSMQDLAALVLKKGANPNLGLIQDGENLGYSPLIAAIQQCSTENVKLLLKYNADSNIIYKFIEESEGNQRIKKCFASPLLCLMDEYFLYKYYDTHGKLFTNVEGFKQIPLKAVSLLEALLKAKNIDLSLKDFRDMNVLDYCFNTFNELKLEVFEKVIKAGGWQLLNTPLQRGQMPIFEAIEQNDKELIKKTIAYGASLKSVNADGETALAILKNTDIGKQALKELPEEFVVSINSMPKAKFCELLFPSLKTLLKEGGVDIDAKKELLDITYKAKVEAQNEPWSIYLLKHYAVCKYPSGNNIEEKESQEDQVTQFILTEVIPIEIMEIIGGYIKPSDMFQIES
jgi:ankyrin repeat protein